MAVIDEKLKEWATPIQAKYIDAVNEHGSGGKAALALGVHKSGVNMCIAAVRKKAALHGYAPDHDMVHAAPEPFVVKGVSTYYNKEGIASGQWVKTQLDRDKELAMIREAIDAFLEEMPALPVQDGPKNYSTDLIPWLQIGDAHLGLLAHAAEVGENFDLKIAEQELCCAFDILLNEMPPTERMVLNDLGDFTHYENMTGTTEASGHPLDYDSRFPKMIKVYSRVMRYLVEKCLTKAQHVDVIVNRGNHSETNDIWMAEMLRVAYGHTGRVHVLDNDTLFIGYRMGNTFVMTHHSHKCKPRDLVNVMISDFRKDFGETEHHYIDIGHIHHGMVLKEYPSVFIESFNHLAALDRWAHDLGYRNRKSMTVVLRSRTFGEVGRRVLPIQEIRERLNRCYGTAIQPTKIAYSV